MRKTYFLFSLFIGCAFVSFGQLDITYPTSRAVFQRNNTNVGTIYFGGNFTTKLDRIEARLLRRSQGRTVEWTTVVNNPTSGFYTASMTSLGGWYQLEVRGIRDGVAVAVASLDRVGIGEVFVICGQSNAEGKDNIGAPANDDRVSRISNLNSPTESLHPFPTFDRIERNSIISPAGNSAWCWGRLGDLLADKLGVPVLFMNTAWEGYDIKQWEVSANGGRGYNTFGEVFAPAGFPFNTVRNSIQQYTHMLGMRAVLFHQGETDNVLGTTELSYFNSMSLFINSLRQATQKNISFVVARVSRNLERRVFQPVIDAQNQVIQQVPNVFPGPFTDNVDERFDGLHFSEAGTNKVADLWNEQLDANFFSSSVPQMAVEPLSPAMVCRSNEPVSPVVLNLPIGFQNPRWNDGIGTNNGVIGSRIFVNAGTYQGRATDGVGNTFFTPTIKYESSPIPAKPNISIDGPQQFCPGTNITRLNSSYAFNNVWNTGAATNGINVSTQGSYSVTHTNVYGCQSVSNPLEITVFPEPVAQITTSGSTDICSDEELLLSSSSPSGNVWSNNLTEQTIRVQNSGDISLTVTNSFGCKNTSSPITVNVRPAAVKPAINIDGNREFCADQSVNLVAISSEPDSSIQFVWNTNDSTKILNVNTAGNYAVLAVNQFNCAKQSDEVSIIVNPLPSKPVVTADGETSLCDDRSLRLTTNQEVGYLWSNGDSLRDVTIFESGNYSVRTVDAKGCVSLDSDPLRVQFYETPLKPLIEKSGVFSIKASLPRALENVSYNWTNGASILNQNAAEIKANEPGNYQAQAFRVYEVENGRTLRCSSTFSDLFFVDVDVAISYQAYPNPTVNQVLIIETLENYKNTTVTFYDFYGRLVRRYFVSDFDSKQTFDLSGLTAGQYILKLNNSNLTVTQRVVVR